MANNAKPTLKREIGEGASDKLYRLTLVKMRSFPVGSSLRASTVKVCKPRSNEPDEEEGKTK